MSCRRCNSSSSASRSLEERVPCPLLSPQRQRGVSPLAKQIANSAVARTITDAIQRPKCLSGRNKKAVAESKITQSTITTHPCHAHGGPQPQPYFLAGNQMCFSFVLISISYGLNTKAHPVKTAI